MYTPFSYYERRIEIAHKAVWEAYHAAEIAQLDGEAADLRLMVQDLGSLQVEALGKRRRPVPDLRGAEQPEPPF
jgi:hypothetical protein